VHDGAADRSYGVQVAQLAGLPKAVITRARDVLEALEKGERERASPKALIDDLPLFSAAAKAPAPAVSRETPSAVEEKLAAIIPDEMSPREALQVLYDLKALVKG
jgi:DNA mismatch repair protein MutS